MNDEARKNAGFVVGEIPGSNGGYRSVTAGISDLDNKTRAFERRPVQFINGHHGLGGMLHFHESEFAGKARFTVLHHRCTLHRTEVPEEELEVKVSNSMAKVAHEYIHVQDRLR